MQPSASIIVPTHGRPQQLSALLDHLDRQNLGHGESFEVVVALDGGADEAAGPLTTDRPYPLQLLPLERVGISPAKNAAVAAARGAVLIFLNDDVQPTPAFVHEHLRAHSQGHRLVLGGCPWSRYDDQRVFDQTLARTRMIFFLDELSPGQSYDYRHAWNINLSVDHELLSTVQGPFCDDLRPYGFEDLELAYRLIGPEPMVYFHPTATATHEHRYSFEAYLRREAGLGVMGPQLWRANPECFRSIFGQGLEDLTETARAALRVDQPDATRTLSRLLQVAQQPWRPQDGDAVLDLFYTAHLPLKRRAFRAGLVAAANNPQTPWQERPTLACRALSNDPVFARAGL